VKVKKDERVNPEMGSGIVMCCTFGDQTDMEWFYAHGLELRLIVNRDGKLNEKAGRFAGLSLKEARKQIVKELKEKGLILGEKPITHAVNVHERCKTEIEFIVSKQWFIKYLDLKDELIAKANAINWFPRYMKTRYDNWVKGLQWDWSLSRQRYMVSRFQHGIARNAEKKSWLQLNSFQLIR
jgi:valyl-tRNA synthetase